jgi:insertion element IS1 protein InsB
MSYEFSVVVYSNGSKLHGVKLCSVPSDISRMDALNSLEKRYRAVGKESGKTNHVERFNNTLRQRVSRLVRKTLAFSKKLENHIGAIWYFVHDYNAKIRARNHYSG